MRVLDQFAREKDGAAAVEFALVSMILVMTLVFLMIVALITYFNQALDYATQKASRRIMTGQVQDNAISQSAFRTQVLCSYLPAAMNCSNVIINIQTVTEGAQPNGYYTLVNSSATALIVPNLSADSNSYSVGQQGSYEYVQVVYPVTFIPKFFATILGGNATFNGAPAYLLTSTAAFKNEQYN